MCERMVLARVGGTLSPCASWAKWCTPSAGEILGVACLEMCAHSCLMVFLALCLWTCLAPRAVANDESTEVKRVALAVGLSAFAVEDAGLLIVERRKFPEWAHVDHHRC